MKRWSLNKKIYSIVAIFIIACATISYVGITKMNAINEDLNRIVGFESKRIKYALELRGLYLSQVVDEKNFILEETKEGMEKIGQKAQKTDNQIDDLLEKFKKIASESGQKDLETFKDLYAQWWSGSLEVEKLSLAADNKAAFKMSFGPQKALRGKAEELINGMVERNSALMDKASADTDIEYANARNLMIAVSVISIAIGFVIAYIVMTQVSKSIDQVISNLTDNSNQVTSAAHQIASSSEELSQASTEQAASLEQTSSSIEELNSMVQKNAENAKRTSEISNHSKENAQKGKAVVQDMIAAIHEINESNNSIMFSVEDSNKKMSEIVEVITEIGNKTKVINDIVFQTKLLSFNASVEAARAGEHGKGFAVVAEEVGNLAQMSGNAAKEITTMLDESILKVQGIVAETKTKVGSHIQEGKKKVETGTHIAKECGDVLDDIVVNISNVNSMAEEISVACQEQAQGVNEITRAMSQLDQVTQTNASTSEEAAQAAEELSAQAESLRGVVRVLFDTVKGTTEVGTQRSVTSTGEYHAAPPSKILPMKKKELKKAPVSYKQPMKKASGADFIPAADDSRFEEV